VKQYINAIETKNSWKGFNEYIAEAEHRMKEYNTSRLKDMDNA
jgi:hypothetical protein